jgi:hypothetical protein
MMSWKAPPSIEISRTPPSKPLSRLRFCRKVSSDAPEGTAIVGESSRLSLTAAGSSTKAAFGAVSATGVGVPELDVTHRGAAPAAFAAVQPAGRAGAVTASKFWPNAVVGGPSTTSSWRCSHPVKECGAFHSPYK